MSQYNDFIQALLIDLMDEKEEISDITFDEKPSEEFVEFTQLMDEVQKSIENNTNFPEDKMDKLVKNKYFELAKEHDSNLKSLLARSYSSQA